MSFFFLFLENKTKSSRCTKALLTSSSSTTTTLSRLFFNPLQAKPLKAPRSSQQQKRAKKNWKRGNLIHNGGLRSHNGYTRPHKLWRSVEQTTAAGGERTPISFERGKQGRKRLFEGDGLAMFFRGGGGGRAGKEEDGDGEECPRTVDEKDHGEVGAGEGVEAFEGKVDHGGVEESAGEGQDDGAEEAGLPARNDEGRKEVERAEHQDFDPAHHLEPQRGVGEDRIPGVVHIPDRHHQLAELAGFAMVPALVVQIEQGFKAKGNATHH